VASPRTSELAATDRPDTVPVGTPAILLSGVTRVFGAVPAVVRADMAVERGEVVLIRGPNGAGKTTLLRIVATVLAPTYGSGSVLGFDLMRGRDAIRARTELVGHRTRLYEDLSAAENLRFVCALYGLDPAGVPEALARVGLADVAGDRVRGFSQGMRQRVALARAILRRPELLVLDEPYAALDPEGRELVDRIVVACRDEGRTVLVASHAPTRPDLATRSLFMDRGRLYPADAPGGGAPAEGEGLRT
jgi:heme ABC exporter ATP-binding subunit CcmA